MIIINKGITENNAFKVELNFFKLLKQFCNAFLKG